MSLIVTTSRLQENPTEISSEKPAHYTNHFRSPLEVDSDSEIALESIKITRSGNITVGPKNYFLHYFGEDPYDRVDEFGAKDDHALQYPRKIKVQEGSYSVDGYIDEVKKSIEAQYCHPQLWKQATTTLQTDGIGDEEGMKITFTQKASASGTNSRSHITSKAYYQIRRPGGAVNETSAGFTYNIGTGVVTRSASDSTEGAKDSQCIGQMVDKPWGLSAGKCDWDVKNALPGEFIIVGMSRPHQQYQVTANGTEFYRKNMYPYSYSQNNNLIDEDGDVAPSKASTKAHFDYAVSIDDQVVRIFNSCQMASGRFLHQEIEYWNSGGAHAGAQMTRAEFAASYDGVRFEALGTNINVWFKDAGKATYSQICGYNLTNDPQYSLKPINLNTGALYPQFSFGKGNIELVNYETSFANSDYSYLYPDYNITTKTYTPGSDAYSNLRITRRENQTQFTSGKATVLNYNLVVGRAKPVSGMVSQVDNKTFGSNSWMRTNSYSQYPYTALNAAGGVPYVHSLYLDKMRTDTQENGMWHNAARPGMARMLGFPDYSNVDQYSLTAPDPPVYLGGNQNIVEFRAVKAFEKNAEASFVRLPNIQVQSYNGAQSGISKIVYQIPQFTPDGRETGALFFAPPEKTYLSLRNARKELLNYLTVQIVDADEKEIRSLSGSTQAVFHIRKAR